MEALVSTMDVSANDAVSTFFQRRLQQFELRHGLADHDLHGLSREDLYRRLEKSVGWTDVRRIELANGNVLFQKNETRNPTETHYDRCYISLIKSLELGGEISPGDTLLETTSGSAGVSFAWVCKKLGYKSVVFMPSFVPEPRMAEIKRLATEVHLSDDRQLYLLGCAQQMTAYFRRHARTRKAQERRLFMPNHSHDFLTPQIFERIMDEVHEQIGGKPVDYFIGGIGNGSTLLGIGSRLKTLHAHAKIIAFEPVAACPFYKAHRERWGKVGPRLIDDAAIPEGFSFHLLTGTGNYGNVEFPFMRTAIERNLIDDICPVPDQKILSSVRYNDELEEEFRLGNGSLVSRYIAEVMAKHVENKNFLVIAYDRADRYGTPRYL
jgi:cysteine synthase